MRPVVKGENPLGKLNGLNIQYTDYKAAKGALISRIGAYCSYCEIWGARAALDVEHIQAKKYKENGIKIYAHLKGEWDNFLLACKNCNSIKGNKNVVYADIYLPHLQNTVLCFVYDRGGYIKLNPNIPGFHHPKADGLMNLVGLDRRPGRLNYSSKDDRWLQRYGTWNLATKYLRKFEKGKADAETIVDLALRRGNWSVWVSVFVNHPEVRTALAVGFDGTYLAFETANIDRA